MSLPAEDFKSKWDVYHNESTTADDAKNRWQKQRHKEGTNVIKHKGHDEHAITTDVSKFYDVHRKLKILKLLT